MNLLVIGVLYNTDVLSVPRDICQHSLLNLLFIGVQCNTDLFSVPRDIGPLFVIHIKHSVNITISHLKVQ